MKVVEVFSRCNLTHSSDGLLAVSGLAKYFAHEFDDGYLAGLWRKDLFHELLLYVDGFREQTGTGNTTQTCTGSYLSGGTHITSTNSSSTLVVMGFETIQRQIYIQLMGPSI